MISKVKGWKQEGTFCWA